MPDILQSFLQQATASGSKSTVLRDLRWFAGIVVSALLIALRVSAPTWVLIFIVALIGIISIIYLAAYCYFAVKAPDALRSEKFTLSKMAIEKSITGDNLAGFIDPAMQRNVLDAPAVTPKRET